MLHSATTFLLFGKKALWPYRPRLKLQAYGPEGYMPEEWRKTLCGGC